jgi:PKD repeat protein
LVLDVAIRPNPAVTGEESEFQGIPDPTSGPITAWQIDYGDGSAPQTSTDGFFYHAYAVAGGYPVTITGFGPLTSSTFSKPLTVSNPPPPLIELGPGSVVPAVPEVGQTVTVTASALPGSGAVDFWLADFGDGSPVQSGLGSVFTHSYASSGPYTISVSAFGPVESATASVPITVVPPPPPSVTGLTAAPTVGTTGSPVVFTPTVSGGAVTSWSWSIDGLIQPGETGATFGHTFLAQAVHNVTVTAIGPGGSSSFPILYAVFDPPVPLTPVPSNPTPIDGDTVVFTSGQAPGSGPVSTWSWAVDGVPVVGSGATLTTALPEGIHTITVFGSGPSGQIGLATLSGFVVAPPPLPVARFTFVLLPGAEAAFTNTSTGAITGWQWDFGDGGTSTLQTPPPHTYVPDATYLVTLVVSGPGGVSAPFMDWVAVPP